MKKLEFPALSSTDVKAILAAFPLLAQTGLERSPLQTSINLRFAESAGQKLLSGERNLSSDEAKVVCLSVLFARNCLSVNALFSPDPETKAEISKYFFSYCKLAPAFDKILGTLESSL